MPGITFTLMIDNAPVSAALFEAIREIQVENNSDMADVFRLRFAVGTTGTGDWTILSDDPFKPLTPVAIRIQVGSGLSEPLISGYVTSQRIEFSSEPGKSILEVVGMDATVLMNLEEKTVAWPNMSDSDIASVIFSDYGFMPKVDSAQPVRQEVDLTTTQRGTDIQFLRRLAERNGYECYVENDPTLNSDVGHFHSPQLQEKAQGVLSVSFGEKTNVTGFNIRYEMLQPVTARASNVDISGKATSDGQAESVSLTNLGSEGLQSRMSKIPVVIPGKTGLSDAGELQTFCQALVDRSSWAIVAEGELDTSAYEGILRAHRPINVRGAGNLHSGSYYVSRVLHTITGNAYTQRFELRRNAIGLTNIEDFMDTGALI
jgi:phage protein D